MMRTWCVSYLLLKGMFVQRYNDLCGQQAWKKVTAVVMCLSSGCICCASLRTGVTGAVQAI